MPCNGFPYQFYMKYFKRQELLKIIDLLDMLMWNLSNPFFLGQYYVMVHSASIHCITVGKYYLKYNAQCFYSLH